jgi:hypothetical protein
MTMQTITINNQEMQVGEELIHYQLKTTPESSNVLCIGINTYDRDLYVLFKGGAQYIYHEVELNTLNHAINCTDSMGKFLHKYITKQHKFDKPVTAYITPVKQIV